MKLLLTTIAAVLVVGCGESQQSAPQAEAKPVVKAPDISLLDAASAGQIGVVKLHLAAGTDVNVKTVSFSTPLHYAAMHGYKEIAELLIDKGADVNGKDDGGVTPLHYAAWNGHKEIVVRLIAEGADVNAKDIWDKTPLDSATRSKHPNASTETAALLRKHGAKTWRELKAEGK